MKSYSVKTVNNQSADETGNVEISMDDKLTATIATDQETQINYLVNEDNKVVSRLKLFNWWNWIKDQPQTITGLWNFTNGVKAEKNNGDYTYTSQMTESSISIQTNSIYGLVRSQYDCGSIRWTANGYTTEFKPSYPTQYNFLTLPNNSGTIALINDFVTTAVGTTTKAPLTIPNGTLTTSVKNGAIERDSSGQLWESHGNVRYRILNTLDASPFINSPVVPTAVIRAGRTSGNFGRPGDSSIDLSQSDEATGLNGAIGIYAITMGYNVMASNSLGITLGYSSKGSNLQDIVIGSFNTSAASYGITLGGTNTNQNNAGLIVGRDNNLPRFGAGGIIVGNTNVVSGTTTTGKSPIIIGRSNNITMSNDITTGSNMGPIIIGDSSTSNPGAYALIFGFGLSAPSYYEIALGCYNTIYTPRNQGASDPLDRLLSIGNGKSASRSDALVMLKNGLITVPALSKETIATDVTGKALVNKEYLPVEIVNSTPFAYFPTLSDLNSLYPNIVNSSHVYFTNITGYSSIIYYKKTILGWIFKGTLTLLT